MSRESASGAVIFLNGASSSGKSTLAAGLQSALDAPFWHYSIDHLREAKVLPWQRIEQGEFPWSEHRGAFFEGFHRSIPAFAGAGNNLIVEHIIETESWARRLAELLADLDVFLVGVHCPLDELERRERIRGDRRIGEARADFGNAHRYVHYDLEVSGTAPIEAVVAETVAAWRGRKSPSALERMR